MPMNAHSERDQLLAGRSWRRLERRAVAAHERHMFRTVVHLAQLGLRLDAVDFGYTPGRLSTVRIIVSNRQIVLAGGRPAESDWAGSDSPTYLLDAGKYRDCWWLTLGTRAGRSTLTGSHLLLVPTGGRGHGRDDLDPPHHPRRTDALRAA